MGEWGALGELLEAEEGEADAGHRAPQSGGAPRAQPAV